MCGGDNFSENDLPFLIGTDSEVCYVYWGICLPTETLLKIWPMPLVNVKRIAHVQVWTKT
jgi:hypothetical protein